MKLLHSSAKQVLGSRFHRAEFLHLLGRHVSVALQSRASKTP
jgi:hypothetical protein